MATNRARLSSLVLVGALALIGALALFARLDLAPRSAALSTAPAANARVSGAQGSGITVEYLGWSHYRLTSPTGKVVVTNPRITDNPDAAITLDEAIARGADIIVAADGHSDDQGNAVELAIGTGAMLVTPSPELRNSMLSRGVPASQLVAANPGSFYQQDGIRIQILHSIHSTGVSVPGEPLYYGGIAGSYMIRFENGYTVYFSGSSAATMDMQWWGEMYQPDMVIQHLSGNREPRDAAMAVKFLTTNNPNLKTVFPHHHRINPQPGGDVRPAELRAALANIGLNVEFIEPDAARPYTLTK